VENTDYTIDTATGVITFDAAPADGEIITIDYSHTMLADGFYERALLRHEDNVKLAAADAVGAVARDQALLLKVVRLLDFTSDGSTLSRELRQHETALRKQAMDEDAMGADGMAIVEMVPNAFAWRERVHAQRLRGRI
jgi:hypothetical protein